jgi:hypothetical protein
MRCAVEAAILVVVLAGDAYGILPVSFERNQGQADSVVEFLSRGDVTVLGTSLDSNGTASFTTSLLASGTRLLRAYYLGDGTHAPGSSTQIALFSTEMVVARSRRR